MAIKRPGFALKQTSVVVIVLLLAALYGMRWYTEKKAVEAAPKPLPAVQAVPAEQQVSPALPQEASQYTAPEAVTRQDESAPYLSGGPSKPDLFTKNVSKSDSDRCVQTYTADPRSLADILVGNYENTFFGPHAAANAASKAVLDQYLICASFTGSMPISCSNNSFQALCVSAAYDDLIYAAVNNDKNPVKCSRFLDLAFAQGGGSPSICGMIRTAVEKRSASGCSQLGNSSQCENELRFLKGRKACATLKPDAAAGCEALADMVSGDQGSWLAEVLRTKSMSACSGLGAKMAKTFCDSSFSEARRKAKESADMEKRGAKKAPKE